MVRIVLFIIKYQPTL